MSYLDDPAHAWKLDDATRTADEAQERVAAWMTLPHLRGATEAMELVVRGAAGLMDREATDNIWLALDTSITWYYG